MQNNNGLGNIVVLSHSTKCKYKLGLMNFKNRSDMGPKSVYVPLTHIENEHIGVNKFRSCCDNPQVEWIDGWGTLNDDCGEYGSRIRNDLL